MFLVMPYLETHCFIRFKEIYFKSVCVHALRVCIYFVCEYVHLSVYEYVH